MARHFFYAAKAFVRRMFSALTRPIPNSTAPHGEQPAEWYDAVFSESEHYDVHYTRSAYYFMWSIIVDRLRQASVTCVLEIGCGTGQFAEFLFDEGIGSYVGLDFSEVAVAKARRRVPSYTFIVGDARISDVYSQRRYDAIVCTEVLEHITEDLSVVSRFPTGCRCLCTVPNFPYLSHVRHFLGAHEVIARYGKYFSPCAVTTLRGTRGPNERFYLIDGVRNGYNAAEF